MLINVYTDGGSRGNPGISGFGFVVLDQNQQVIHQESKFLGVKTNNEAEYLGLIAALTWVNDNVKTHHISEVNFYSDSQLLVRQMQQIYKVKSPGLKPLNSIAVNLLSSLSIPYKFTDIRREYNQLADELANRAMDQKL